MYTNLLRDLSKVRLTLWAHLKTSNHCLIRSQAVKCTVTEIKEKIQIASSDKLLLIHFFYNLLNKPLSKKAVNAEGSDPAEMDLNSC